MSSPDYDLIQAVMGEDLEATRAALASGGNPDVVNEGSIPALQCAARTACPEIVEALITAGANVNITNSAGETPLSSAIFNSKGAEGDSKLRFEKVVELLKTAGAR